MNGGDDRGRTVNLLAGSVDDDVFGAMSDPYRRHAVYFLLDRDTVSVEELVDVAVGWTGVSTGLSPTEDDHERVRIAFHHQHLPLLERAGLVVHDRTAGRVSLAELSEAERQLVERSYRYEGEVGAST